MDKNKYFLQNNILLRLRGREFGLQLFLVEEQGLLHRDLRFVHEIQLQENVRQMHRMNRDLFHIEKLGCFVNVILTQIF